MCCYLTCPFEGSELLKYLRNMLEFSVFQQCKYTNTLIAVINYEEPVDI